MNTKYDRVIPRDFFNESKLLKCMGNLQIAITDCKLPEGVKIEIDENGEAFKIALTDDGYLTIANYPVRINGKEIIMKTTYNSKSNFPLFGEYEYCDYLVFDEQGKFTAEFSDFAINF